LPTLFGLITEDDGETPLDLTGYTITIHIGYTPTPLVKSAYVVPHLGEFSFYWIEGDLKAGEWPVEIQIVNPGRN
jgi:hypothetical protein